MIGFLAVEPGRDCPRSPLHGARKRSIAWRGDRGINGGDPRLCGEAAVYAAKAPCHAIDGEPAVVGSSDSGNPKLNLGFFSGLRYGHTARDLMKSLFDLRLDVVRMWGPRIGVLSPKVS